MKVSVRVCCLSSHPVEAIVRLLCQAAPPTLCPRHACVSPATLCRKPSRGYRQNVPALCGANIHQKRAIVLYLRIPPPASLPASAASQASNSHAAAHPSLHGFLSRLSVCVIQRQHAMGG